MEVLIYSVEVSLYWLLLYGCYWFLLRHHTFFRWNRAYLLGSLLGAFVLPLMQYPEAAPPLPAAVYEVSPLPPAVPGEVTATSVAPRTPPSAVLNWMDVLWALYAVGVVVMAMRLYRHLRSLFLFVRQGTFIHMEGYTLVLSTTDSVGSFSFLKWVVVNRSDYEQHFDTILNHELVHVRQRHSLDILLVEVLRVLFWFHPVLLLYKQSLQQVHEYLADQQAPNRDHYAEFLVAYALDAPLAALTNHFFKSSLLKDRVRMLYKNRNSRWSLSTYAAVAVVVLIVALVVASCEREEVVPATMGEQVEAGQNVRVEGIVRDSEGKPIAGATIAVEGGSSGTTTDTEGYFRMSVPSNSKLIVSYKGFTKMEVSIGANYKSSRLNIMLSEELSRLEERTEEPPREQISTIDGQPIFTVAEEQPEFPGGITAMYEYINQNMKYPPAAVRAKVQGIVYLSFVITSQGEIKDIQILKSMGFGTDVEAKRIVSSMPRWQPGIQSGQPVNVRYNLPINFQLD
ncbi:TonB family protein [Telluribacter sp. SYSU D00476]|uniref:TonB family protein n=1 Tax=Telluribacter sp. SYSU D00476 TaxID=2811430 RepID=UPI001FF4287D|nr:TonB family protein [Telluribacter sp. SYSU D00476]